MGNGFIHAYGRSKRSAADKRQAAQLQQALNGSVFAVPAVQHGEHAVDRNRLEAVRRIDGNPADAPVRAEKRAAFVIALFPFAGRNLVVRPGVKDTSARLS